jgi:acyl-CoA synthetase (AMP-forming)/AMP-acid ligase II
LQSKLTVYASIMITGKLRSRQSPPSSNLRDETQEAFAGARFHSGDVGYFGIVDRAKVVRRFGGVVVVGREVETAPQYSNWRKIAIYSGSSKIQKEPHLGQAAVVAACL